MANDKSYTDDNDYSLDSILNEDFTSDESFSLESILAEYKGDAFMEGDKKTPSDELQRKTDDILREVMGRAPEAPPPVRPEPEPPEPEPVESFPPEPEPEPEPRPRFSFFKRRDRDDYEDEEEEEEDYEDEDYDEPPKKRFSLFRRRDRDQEPEEDDFEEEPVRNRRGRRSLLEDGAVEPPTGPAYDSAPEIDQSVFDEPEKDTSFTDLYRDLNRQAEQEERKAAASREKFDFSAIRDAQESQSAQDDQATREIPSARSLRETLNARDARAADTSDRRDGRSARHPPVTDDFVREVEENIGAGEDEEYEDEEPRRRGVFGLFGRRRDRQDDYDEGDEDWEDEEDEEEPEAQDDGTYVFDVEPDPDIKAETAHFANLVPSVRLRLIGATVLTAVMLLITVMFTAGKSAPFGIGTDPVRATGVLVIMELIVIALGIDVMIRGLEDIVTVSPGAESLVFISCVMSVLDGFSMLLRSSFTVGLPLAAISACSMTAAIHARKSYYMAICDSLKASRASSATSGVAVDNSGMPGRSILKKVTGAYDGFYAKLTTPDPGEELYDRAAPLLVIIAFVLSVLSSLGHGAPESFAHSFSLMTAVCAAFPATAIFAVPFRYAASAARKSGGAIAGFAGARDIYYADGALISDLDVFPVGSVTLSGMKVFEGVSQQKVIEDTASLIIASDSGLRKVFEELLRTRGLFSKRTDDFACYDGGGIGAVVEGERVLVGTGAFMNLMGLRVPDELNTATSVFTAINDELAGVFSLNYVPANSVQSALVSLLGTNINLLMAVRDFNVTPNTIKQKFKVSMDGVEYLPVDTTYELSQNRLPDNTGVSAVLCRGGLAPFAEVITRGRLLKLITELNTAVTAIGTLIGMLVMFFICWAGAFASATATNIFIYMAITWLAVYIMSQGTRRRMK